MLSLKVCIGAVFRAATRVKMQSNGQGTYWELVKRSSNVLGHYLQYYWQSRGMAECLHMRSSKDQWQKFCVIEQSGYFSTVKKLDSGCSNGAYGSPTPLVPVVLTLMTGRFDPVLHCTLQKVGGHLCKV